MEGGRTICLLAIDRDSVSAFGERAGSLLGGSYPGSYIVVGGEKDGLDLTKFKGSASKVVKIHIPMVASSLNVAAAFGVVVGVMGVRGGLG